MRGGALALSPLPDFSEEGRTGYSYPLTSRRLALCSSQPFRKVDSTRDYGSPVARFLQILCS